MTEIDKLESCFVARGYSVKRIAKKFEIVPKEVRRMLLEVGLEVEGRVKKGLTPASKAVMDRIGAERYDNREDCFAAYLKDKV
jgi:hypothetical protein